jgi:hypothetical protein
LLWKLFKSGGRLGPAAYRSVRQLLRPEVEPNVEPPADTYAVAVRKIHRMRKPMFLTALWLRANFDVEYLGLRLPGVPCEPESASALERDLDFIEASHFDRLNAERLRARRALQLETFVRTLEELKLDYVSLATRLRKDFPPLVERRGEIVRALVAAAMADYDDVRSLATAVAGLRMLFAFAADPRSDLAFLPTGLSKFAKDERTRPRRKWFRRRDDRRLFNLPCFPKYEFWQQKRIRHVLGIHRRVVGEWVDAILEHGENDPLAAIEHRLLDVVRRVDLWSDQLVTLRTLQTMTILDVDHYCRFVWELGRYSELGDEDAPQQPIGANVHPSRNGKLVAAVVEEEEILTALE